MSRYDHKIETSLEGIEHLSKEKKEKEERKMKEKNHYYNERNSELLTYESWRLSVKSLLV